MAGEGALAMKPTVLTVECSRCELPALCGPDGELPEEWTKVGGKLNCPDCRLRVWPGEQETLRQILTGNHGDFTVGPTDPTSRFRGCQVDYQVTHGAVALTIRAGTAPDVSRPRQADFILHSTDLDRLITRLQVLQLELIADQQPRDY